MNDVDWKGAYICFLASGQSIAEFYREQFTSFCLGAVTPSVKTLYIHFRKLRREQIAAESVDSEVQVVELSQEQVNEASATRPVPTPSIKTLTSARRAPSCMITVSLPAGLCCQFETQDPIVTTLEFARLLKGAP